MFQILESLQEYCNDYAIATYLYTIKQVLDIIHLVIPILLLVMVAIQMVKMMISPDDKKSPKTLLNKFIAAVIVFFVPYIVNLCVSLLPDNFEIAKCWEQAEQIRNEMNQTQKSQ